MFNGQKRIVKPKVVLTWDAESAGFEHIDDSFLPCSPDVKRSMVGGMQLQRRAAIKRPQQDGDLIHDLMYTSLSGERVFFSLEIYGKLYS